MGYKQKLAELVISAIARYSSSHNKKSGEQLDQIFILRNNDIGDLLVITPLFDALKRRFPQANIVAGIGKWNFPVLQNNPHLSETIPVNAPWHNKNCCHFPHNSIRGLFNSTRYILRSSEVKKIRQMQFDVGIDVLGSPEGSLLMLKAGIPYRLGVKGYAGGHTAANKHVTFNAQEHVGRSALRFAELLGATSLPEIRPQIFLTPNEIEEGQSRWNFLGSPRPTKRVVIGPGGGFADKCWPLSSFVELASQLKEMPVEIIIVGGNQDSSPSQKIAEANSRAKNLAGQLTLRETFGVVAASDLVLCNSSMLMHVAAAFSKKHFVLLGESFPSATAHKKQWGYENLSTILGKEENRPGIFSAEEVFSIIQPEI